MQTGLDGKRALVLGATRGLGFAIAKGLAQEGARVIVAGRTTDKAVAAANAIGQGARGHPCDTGKPGDVDALWQAVEHDFGGLDVLILNSGGPPAGPARGVSSEDWRKNFESMFVGLVRMADHALPGMIERGFGRIVAIASSGAVQPITNLGISNSIRPALVGWCKTLSNEVGKHGVTVNVMLPGRIQTERVEEIDAANAKRTGKPIETVRADARDRIPAGRYGEADEFAAAAVFLASAGAAYITGSMIRVDGGAIACV
jgi:3-oxoacyl-[acyl-carrier protein] reductase